MVESFEVSNGNVFGDLLSKKEKKKQYKVGLYTGGYFEYWRMYPKTLENFVRSDMEVVYKNLKRFLSSNVEVIWPGIISTIDEAEKAGKLFEEEKIDMVVYIAATYNPDYMSIQTLCHVKDIPLVVFVRQQHKDINFDSNYEQTLRNSGLISTAQLTGAFKKMGWYDNFEVVIGADYDEEPYKRIKKYFNAVCTYCSLKGLNIGSIGHVFRGMYDFECDKTKVRGSLGPSIIDIQVDHFLNVWKKVTDKETDDFMKEVKDKYKYYAFQNVTEEDLFRSCKFTIALRKIIERYRLDALCFLGQHYTEAKTGTTAYLASSILASERKYMVTSEGDVIGLIMMCIMNKLTGTTPLFGEWGEFGEKENAIMIMMHGFADPNLAKDSSRVRFTSSPENWGYVGKGFSVEFTAKPGIVTVGHFINDKEIGWRMLISRGEVLDVKRSIPCRETTLILKTETPVKEFIKKLLRTGFSHHAIICYGDLTEELGYIADLMRIEKDYI